MQEKLSKAVHSTKKQRRKYGKNFSVLYNKNVSCSSRMLRVNIVDDRINGKPLHKPPELFGIHFPQFVRRTWPGKMPTVNPLIEE